MKKIIALGLLFVLILTFTACSGAAVGSAGTLAAATGQAGTVANPAGETEQDAAVVYAPITVEYESEDLDTSTNSSGMSYIKLEGNTVTVEGDGVTVNGTVVTITKAGRYSLSGVLNDGQIVVNTEDKETVRLVLNGANITCSTSAPIYVANAEKTVITLAAGTENYVADGSAYRLESAESDEPNAAIFSHDDLTFNGNGALTVNATYNHGIVSKDDLKITGGTLIINATNDGIKGRDSIAVKAGTITVNAGGDGLQANNTDDAEKGYIVIEGGTLNITAGLDAVQAATRLVVSSGTLALVSGGGSSNGVSHQAGWGNQGMESSASDADTTASAKGLKAGVDIAITGGMITIDSADDAIHSNGSLTLSGGELLLTSGDDGLHSDATLTISGGQLNITQSYEGIESAMITINGGEIHLLASDDGINTAGGVDGSSVNGRPGQNDFMAAGNYPLYLNGGYIVIDAGGDGIDANGPIAMTGGTVIVNGPTDSGNGPLDYTGEFKVTGGLLVAAGSAGMAQAPSASSTQYSVLYHFASQQAAGTPVHIETQDGEGILTFVPTKVYQSVVLCSPELKNGTTYLVYTGGSSTGTVTDGLYSGGTYTAGTQITSFTISSMVTSAGSAVEGGPGRPGGNPGLPGGQRP